MWCSLELAETVGVVQSGVVNLSAFLAVVLESTLTGNFVINLVFSSSQCCTTGVTKVMVCLILSGMVHIKEHLLLIGKSSPCWQ